MSEKRSKYLYHLNEVPLTPLTKEVSTRFILSEKALLSFIEQPPGATFPVHQHPVEQILVILEGSEEHIVGEEKFLMKTGDVCIHPSNVPHGGHTPTGFKGIDIFIPPRGDYIELMKKHAK
jgi:quercetin dioxygenase-like cupin family protein